MPGRRGDWDDLSPATRRRWTARYGGRGDRELRERRARAAYGHGASIPRKQAGHEAPADRPTITALVELPGRRVAYVELSGLTRGERRRVARHDSLLGQLAQGRISGHAFRRRVGGWQPVDGFRLVSDPTAALAAIDDRRQADEPLGPYPYGGG